MLVRLEGEVQHLAGLIALLGDELIANSQETGEAELNDLIKMNAALIVGRSETPGAADGEQALEASKDRGGVICVEKFRGVVHEIGPLVWKVEVQDPLQDRNKLLAHTSLGGSHDGQQPIAEARLFIFGYQGLAGVLVGFRP